MDRKHYHFIGIGGIGMSGIAKLFLREGARVSGSDLKEGLITASLESLGAQIRIGHAAAHIQKPDVVVYSSAIKDDNPELVEARRLGVPVIKRAEALAYLMEDKTVITVAGSHGKTTTTSMVSYLLLEAGLSPTVVIGGILKNIDTNACAGCGRYFVAEADESDGSFLCYKPSYSIITNIDREHLDYYNNFPAEIEAFRQFMEKTDPAGCLFCCDDDPHLKELVRRHKNKYVLFGLTAHAQVYADDISINGLHSRFNVHASGKPLGRFSLSLGGMHNISNSLAVISLGLELGIDQETIKRVLVNYKGAGRRIEIRFQSPQYLLIDDYGHHPTEIKATLAAVKNIGRERIVAVFQPHRYSRTKILMDDFVDCFTDADYLVLTDIYAASEPVLEGVTSRVLYERIKERFPQKEVHYVPKNEIVNYVLGIRRQGDIVITLGAGDIARICDELAGKF